ncbi:MAG TPA: polyphosphate kinase 2 family protein [Cyclobacteriaceae bacterium]
MKLDKLIDFNKHKVTQGTKVSLGDYDTEYTGERFGKREAEALLEAGREQLAEMQDKLYAHNRYSVLIVLQAMDAAGKDSSIKHIMSGFNPQGVKVFSFKAPSVSELDHDFLWRHYKALPARGEICIFNRSHYENVLVTRVHPEYILTEHLPGIDAVDKITDDFWSDRFRQICRFEENLSENGTMILKFFLHLSLDEQKKRFLERIDDPSKNWKFSMGDLVERGFWNSYQRAYEEAISATSTDYAPWFIIPADDKWFSRLAIAGIIYQYFEKLSLHYPSLNESQKAELKKARLQLMSEQTVVKTRRKSRTSR